MEDIKIIGSYVHGSADSVDKDIVYVLDKIPEYGKCKGFCATLEGNPNLIVIKDGVVEWCYKGSVDEVNNGLFTTIPLHPENKVNPIKRMVDRNLCLKVIRATRGIISHLSRSQYREEIKSSLRGSLEERLEIIKMIADNMETIDFDSLNHNMSGADILKLIAFQVGQTLSLIDGVELYTKKDIVNYLPVLGDFLYREKNPHLKSLEILLLTFVMKVRQLGIVDCGDRVVEYQGHKYDTKEEKIIE